MPSERAMDASVLAQIEDLQQLKTGALRTKYEEQFGVKARSLEQALSIASPCLASAGTRGGRPE